MSGMRRAVIICGVIGLSLAGAACSQNDDIVANTSTTTSLPATTTTSAGDTSFAPAGYDTIDTTDGRTRSYRVVDLSGDEPAPLLFVLHGFGGNAEAMRDYTGVEQAVETSLDDGAIVVYPNGTGLEEGLPQSWNAGGCCPFAIYDMVDDVAFFDQLISALTAQYDVDESRVWVVGHSNGGMMAYRLACELSTRVTAIGVAAGALMIETCQPGRAVSALHLHGDLDSVVPLAGGETAGIIFPSTRDSFTRFAAANSCRVDELATGGPTGSCPNGSLIRLATDATWTHDWQPVWTSRIIEFLNQQIGG